jgi:hypothetical protein
VFNNHALAYTKEVVSLFSICDKILSRMAQKRVKRKIWLNRRVYKRDLRVIEKEKAETQCRGSQHKNKGASRA